MANAEANSKKSPNGGSPASPFPKTDPAPLRGRWEGPFPDKRLQVGASSRPPAKQLSRRGEKPSTKLTYGVCAPGRDKEPFQGAEAGEKRGPHVFPAMRIALFSFLYVQF